MGIRKPLTIIASICILLFAQQDAFAPMYYGAKKPPEPISMPPVLNSRGSMKITPEWTVTEYTDGYESTQKQPGDPGYGITASGTVATEGRTAACDPHVLPMGTRIRIPQLGETLTCEDVGQAIKGRHVDVFVNSVDRALQFGKRQMTVEVLHEPATSTR